MSSFNKYYLKSCYKALKMTLWYETSKRYFLLFKIITTSYRALEMTLWYEPYKNYFYITLPFPDVDHAIEVKRIEMEQTNNHDGQKYTEI